MSVIPYVIESDGRGERSYDIYSRLLKDRIIMLGSAIDANVANSIVAQLLFLNSQDPKKDITMYVNSPGGVIYDGLAIIDTMNHIEADVSTVSVGFSASMGSLILTSGAKGKRFALKNSTIMIHQPMGGANGQATEIEITYKEISRLKELSAKILADTSGKKLDDVVKDMDRDNFMTAAQAKTYGIIDKVID